MTSRSARRLRSEQRYAVLPLAAPAEDEASPEAIGASPAVRLFIDRARTVAADFALDPLNLRAVAAICRHLDGIPLAIELAAARTILLPPELLLSRMERRLPLLTGGAADLPTRQRTLRQTLDWSYALLGPHEQALLRRLAVFTGSWTLAAAEAVSPMRTGRLTQFCSSLAACWIAVSSSCSAQPVSTAASRGSACSRPSASTPASTRRRQAKR